MTRQEKKEELIGLFSTGAIYLGDLIDECFEFGQQHPRWISVEEGLPPFTRWNNGQLNESEDVLAYNGHMVYIDRLVGGKIHWWVNTESVTPTHWMPMPSLPEHIAGVSKMIGSSGKPNNCKKGEEIKGNFGKTSPNKKGCKQ